MIKKIKELLHLIQQPLQVRYLSKKIKGWSKYGPILIMYPREKILNEISFGTIPCRGWSADKEWQFVATIRMVSAKEMDDYYVDLYRNLKALECQLRWRDHFGGQPIFETISEPFNIANLVPNVKMSSELLDLLNSDANLMKLIKEIKPDTIHIILTSSVAFDTKKTIIDEYNNPKNIMWQISLIKGPEQTPMKTKSFSLKIYEILKKTGFLVRELSSTKLKFTSEFK